MHKDILLDEIANSYQLHLGGGFFSLNRLSSYNALVDVLSPLKRATGLMTADAMFNNTLEDAQLEQEFVFAIAQEARFYALKAEVAASMTPEARNTYLCMKMHHQDSDEYYDYFEQLVEQIEPLLDEAVLSLGIAQGVRPQARAFLSRAINGSELSHPFFRWTDA